MKTRPANCELVVTPMLSVVELIKLLGGRILIMARDIESVVEKYAAIDVDPSCMDVAEGRISGCCKHSA